MGESSKVRMEISREMHKWFKSIDAKTNDERMQRVIDVNEEYKDLLVKFRKLEIICKQRGEACFLLRGRTLIIRMKRLTNISVAAEHLKFYSPCR